MAPNEEEERLTRQEEADLQAGFALSLSREEVGLSSLLVASPEAIVGPAPSGLMLSATLRTPRQLLRGSFLKPRHERILRRELQRIKASCLIVVLIRGGVLEPLCALESWGLLLVRHPRWMLLEFLLDVWRELSELEERIRLIDGCASRVEYHYHVLRESIHLSMGRPRARDLFGTSCIMNKEKRQKVIAAGKHPKEAGMAQVAKELSLCLTILGGVAYGHCVRSSPYGRRGVGGGARSMLDGRHGREGSKLKRLWRSYFRSWALERLNWNELEQLRRSFTPSQACIRGLSDQAADAREEASRLSSELGTTKAEAATLQD
ncbi:hypothetical protein ACLOJK_020257 [Asimina triloba]